MADHLGAAVAATFGDPGVRVVATDLLTGETQEVLLRPGQYVVTCAEPRYVAGEQRHGNGTITLTLKRHQGGEDHG